MTTETNENDQNDTTGLVSKNKELIGKIKKLQERLDQIESEKEEAESLAAEKVGDWEKLKSQMEAKHKKALDTLASENEKLSSELKTIRVDNEISQVIARSGVSSAYVPAVESLLLRRAEYADGKAMIDGQPISEWAKTYFDNEGAIYRPAPNNSGAGSTSNDGSYVSSYQKPASPYAMPREVQALANTNPQEYNALMSEWGFDNLKV